MRQSEPRYFDGLSWARAILTPLVSCLGQSEALRMSKASKVHALVVDPAQEKTLVTVTADGTLLIYDVGYIAGKLRTPSDLFVYLIREKHF